MSEPLSSAALDQLFAEARTRNRWSDRPVSAELLHQVYDLAKMGPTAFNSCPARFVFVTSPEGREKLAGVAMPGNQAKIRAAPVTAIIGIDEAFPEQLPALNPGRGEIIQGYFKDEALTQLTAFRNATLQGAYLMLAARALGLDCGPMSGFDNAAVDAAFFAGTRVKSNFLCSLGYGTDENLYPRAPRLAFDAVARLA